MLPFYNKDHITLRAKIRDWAEKNLFAASQPGIEERARTITGQLGRETFLSYVIPKDYGGVRTQVEARDLCILREELARADALADTMVAMQAMGSYPITLAGQPEQKGLYLPAIAKGECMMAFALTEPEAGSDLSCLTTRAVRHQALRFECRNR